MAFLHDVNESTSDAEVRVGFPEGSKEADGTPTPYVAYLNEYGHKRQTENGGTVVVPPRPFMRSMIEKGKPGWSTKLGDALKRYDYDVERAMDYLGLVMLDELKESIQSNDYAPLAPSTVQRKGHSQTLIDTGDMLHNAVYQVTKGGAE